jgi:SAM-dependent methyltransferase
MRGKTSVRATAHSLNRPKAKRLCPVCLSLRMPEVAHESYQCQDCLHIFINYKGDGLNYHKEEYRKNEFGTRGDSEVDSEGKFTEDFHEVRKDICAKRLQQVEPLLKDCPSCLDVGAGGGTFAKTLKENTSVNVECQEISDVCADNLESYGFKTYRGDFCSVDFEKSYDLVTCWHALEHIKDIHSFSDKAAQVCKKFLVIEVPTNRFSFLTERNKKNPDKQWDGHYHYFSGLSLVQLFEKNFSLVDIKEGVQAPAILASFKKNDNI